MPSRNCSKLHEVWLCVQKFLDIKSGAIIGLFSLEMLAIIAFYAVKGHELPTTVRDVYLGVLTCFTTHGVAQVIKGAKDAVKD